MLSKSGCKDCRQGNDDDVHMLGLSLFNLVNQSHQIGRVALNPSLGVLKMDKHTSQFVALVHFPACIQVVIVSIAACLDFGDLKVAFFVDKSLLVHDNHRA